MKINEVETLVGITKKNIRFYEEQGLLSPRRNSQNGYRDYGEAEVSALRRIKLMRKLGVPLEEIRQMQSGVHTVGDGMRRHLVSLERERQNLADAARLCAELTDSHERLDHLDAESLLARMEQMEQEGTTFMNKQKQDTRRRRYVAPVLMTVLMAVLMAGLIWLFLWSSAAAAAGAVCSHSGGGDPGCGDCPGPAHPRDRAGRRGRRQKILNGHPFSTSSPETS